jgi:ketosteroid isomerase-like protein
MNRSIAGGSVLAWALVLACQPALAGDGSEARLKALAMKYLGMVRTENPTPLQEVARMLAEDFTQSTSFGTFHKGKAENMALYRKSVDEIRKAFSRLEVSFDVRSVRGFPRTVILFGKIRMSGTLKAGNAPFRREVWETMIFENRGRRWLLVHEHSTLARSPEREE